MKKKWIIKSLIVLMVFACAAFSMSACGSQNEEKNVQEQTQSDADNKQNTANQDVSNQEQNADNQANAGESQNADTDEQSNDNQTDSGVDQVANKLGLGEGVAIDYESIGASAGKEFRYGDTKVILLKAEFGTETYDRLIGSGSIGNYKAAAFKGGYALIFDGKEDDEIINKFKGMF